MRKPTICICENKDADQLRGNREADQRLCFRYIDSTIPLLSKSEISSLKPSSVAVQPGLCRTRSETRMLVFSGRGSVSSDSSFHRNAQTGQEFSIVGHTAPSSSCDSFGWFMISTKATCFYEMGDRKPTFYYAPGTSLAHWGFGTCLNIGIIASN